MFDPVNVCLRFDFELVRCRSRELLLVCFEGVDESAFLALEVFDVFCLEHLIEASAESGRADLWNAQGQRAECTLTW